MSGERADLPGDLLGDRACPWHAAVLGASIAHNLLRCAVAASTASTSSTSAESSRKRPRTKPRSPKSWHSVAHHRGEDRRFNRPCGQNMQATVRETAHASGRALEIGRRQAAREAGGVRLVRKHCTDRRSKMKTRWPTLSTRISAGGPSCFMWRRLPASNKFRHRGWSAHLPSSAPTPGICVQLWEGGCHVANTRGRLSLIHISEPTRPY